MIKGFRHKGLERFFRAGSARGIQSKHCTRLTMQLAMLNAAIEIDDMDRPGWGLHPLKGQKAGVWAIKVSANWRVTFRFEDGDAYVVDYEDYH